MEFAPPSPDLAQVPRRPSVWRALLAFILSLVAMNIAAAVLMFVAVIFIPGGLDQLSQYLENPEEMIRGEFLLAFTALATPAAWLCLWFFRVKIERRRFRLLGLGGARRLYDFVIGWLIGALAPGFFFGLGLLFGAYRLGGEGSGIWASPESFWLWGLPLLLCGFILQGSTEELTVRGYLQRSMVEWSEGRSYSIFWIMLLPSLIFSLSHLINPGFGLLPLINTVLIGVIFACISLGQGALWMVFGLHAGWNLALSAIWSLPVSGLSTMHLLAVEPVVGDRIDTLLWGGTYGPEGGLALSVVLVIVLPFVFRYAQRKRGVNGWEVVP